MSAHSLSIAETDLSFVTHDLQPVALDHLVRLLQTELCHVFESVQVELIQECPDLSVPPFDLATKGLGSGQCLALDIGGVPNLVPVPQLQKPDYAITAICDQLQPMLPYDQLLVIGAAAGPFRETGTCCELIPNVKLVRSPRTPNSDSGDQAKQSRWTVTDNRTHCARLIPNRKAKSRDDVPLIPNLLRMKTDHFTLLGNLFVSDGHQGPVIQIKARKRLIEKDASINGSLPVLLRTILNRKMAPFMPISLGGVMLIRRGRARMHIMPDFSATPLADESQVNQWLRFFEFDAPMFCACVLHSMDPADLGLRLEHTHGYSVENETGGHFHQDVSPAVIEYEAYFRPINRIVRESHKK